MLLILGSSALIATAASAASSSEVDSVGKGVAAGVDAGAIDAAKAPAPLVEPAKLKMLMARAERKRSKANPARFDKPQEAMAFFVNKRTGPILTRGPQATVGARPLDSNLYRAALAQARTTPFHSTRTNSILAADTNLAAAPGALLGSWTSLGPSNQGGRTRQLLIDPANASIMYTAAVGGGVWKSTDGGATWNQLTDLLLPNISVVSLAMDPKNSQILYAGTGEGVFNFDAIRGAGIFKTTDGGATWAPLAATVPAATVAPSDFSYVFNIVVSSRSSQRLYASTRTGVFRSNDGGATWTQAINGAPVNGCHDIVMQVKRAIGYVYAACGTFTQASIYRALDGPATAFASVFTATGMGRTSLAIAPSNENYVYAMSASNGPGVYTDGLLAVYRSTAGGNPGSWTTQVSNTNPNKLNTLLLSNPVYAYASCVGAGSAGLYSQAGMTM